MLLAVAKESSHNYLNCTSNWPGYIGVHLDVHISILLVLLLVLVFAYNHISFILLVHLCVAMEQGLKTFPCLGIKTVS